MQDDGSINLIKTFFNDHCSEDDMKKGFHIETAITTIIKGQDEDDFAVVKYNDTICFTDCSYIENKQFY